MKVDDAFYRPGEKIEKEGVHVLTIEALIQQEIKEKQKRGLPSIIHRRVIEFEGIEDGENMEKEKHFMSEQRIWKIRLNTLKLMERNKTGKNRRRDMKFS